ncbi:nicotinamide-nucleotide amidohydrolase family protein [Starkeya koreensis]|uniref:Nicotinamide-nucleotide amidohydrolase family protein n=1 Tax=Ancylobacter koreensis TaxID=266121 RepID=A0ABT0DMV7_9HYPH|nr:nicotinamide-nucleotide amidohydrolase family protein [Ancylobacter koreensis]MCK0208472.1 nicotinamide-nucleotide amidohydrolase family protein [Ancylobacter koreensis]
MSEHADAIDLQAIRVLDLCRARGLTVATAESCTGGLVAGALTDIAGSSDVLDRGFVTYSNAAKREMLGVAAATLDTHGAVSEETAREMAAGLLRVAGTSLGVAITGIAGPGGGSASKPVGLVHFAAAAASGKIIVRREVFAGQDRAGVRRLSVLTALAMLAELAAG